jgi:hypothetical protein
MREQERRLTAKLASFFASVAPHVSSEIFAQLAREGVAKASDHIHVKPENAEPIGLPVADVVTRANILHASWELVREGKFKPVRRTVPLADLIATQQVVDSERVAKHEAALRAGESVEPGQAPPLVLEWDGDLFLLGGHHGTQAAKNLGVREIEVAVLTA